MTLCMKESASSRTPTVKLHIDDSVPPVAKPHRRIPINLREKVEEKLRQLEKDDMIEKVDGPTPWVSQPVFPLKSSDPTDICMCVYMTSANKAILRTCHITPTIEETMSDLNGAVEFSKLDLNQGYHQLLLDEDSRYIATFTTHWTVALQTPKLWHMMCVRDLPEQNSGDYGRNSRSVECWRRYSWVWKIPRRARQ